MEGWRDENGWGKGMEGGREGGRAGDVPSATFRSFEGKKSAIMGVAMTT